MLLDTGEPLKVETLSGAELKKRGLDAGEPVGDTTQVVVISFPAIKNGQSARLRITETYTDPARYLVDGDELVWDRAFGRPRNTVVLPAGWTVVASSIPGSITQDPDGRQRLSFENNRNDEIQVLIRRARRVERSRCHDKMACDIAGLIAAALTAPAAQSLDPITAEDTLNVRTANVLDLSDDGRRVAIGVRRLADNATTDHRRYGDPTYFAPSMVELMVIDTATGAADRIGKGLLNVRQAAWNASGAQARGVDRGGNAGWIAGDDVVGLRRRSQDAR